MKPTPTPHTQKIANLIAEHLQPEGWEVGTGDEISVVLFMPDHFNFKTEQEFFDFIAVYKTLHKVTFIETIEFHFYKGNEWRGGIVMVPKFE